MQAEQNMSFEELFAEARPAFSLLISAHAPLDGFWTMLLAIVVAGSLWYCSKCWYQQQAFNLTDVMTSLDIMAEPVILMSHHTIAFVNNATLTTFGYDSKAELVGKHVSILMQQKEAIAHDSFVGRYEETGQRRVIGKPRGERGHSVRAEQQRRFPQRLPTRPCTLPPTARPRVSSQLCAAGVATVRASRSRSPSRPAPHPVTMSASCIRVAKWRRASRWRRSLSPRPTSCSSRISSG